MADNEVSLSNVHMSFLEEKSVMEEEELEKDVIKIEEQCQVFPELDDSNLSGWGVKDEVVVTEEKPANEEGEECGGVDRDRVVETGLEVEAVMELNVDCEETVSNVIDCGQAGQEALHGIRMQEGEVEGGGKIAVSDVGDLELGKKGGEELVPVANTKVEMVVVREELDASHGGEMAVSEVGDLKVKEKGEEMMPVADTKLEMVVAREELEASHGGEMAVSDIGDVELGEKGGEELVPVADTKVEMVMMREELKASCGSEMTISDVGDVELVKKGEEELVPGSDSKVETVVVGEKSEATDAKTETEIGVEIGEQEKVENEEVSEVERMEFQMVENHTKVLIEDVIDFKEKISVELNDSEIGVADEVTIEEISTSKDKAEFEMTNEANSEVVSAGAGKQVFGLDCDMGVVGIESLEAVKDGCAEDKGVVAEDNLLAETQVVQEKDMNVDVSKDSESAEPVNIAETAKEAVAEDEMPEADTKMETGTEMEAKSDNFVEWISSNDTKLAIESEMEIEKTNDGVYECGEELGDSLAALQDEDEAMIPMEETGTQDTEMETEINVADSGKVPGGKQKKGKKSKTLSSSKTAAKASGRKLVGDDVCFICFDGGDLVMCDRRGCPKAYHPSCVNRDEAFFKAKGIWNCGWHLCSICEKNAHYKCYTCAFSLCKGCIKDAVILCVRGNKGFCETCMRIVLLIENNEQENKDAQIDFDDRSSWEYLFKDYYIELKSKLNLSSVEVADAKNPWRGTSGTIKQMSPEAHVDDNDGGSGSDNTEKLETHKSKKRKLKKGSKPPSKKEVSVSSGAKAHVDSNDGRSGPESTEKLETRKSKRRKLKKRSKPPSKKEESVSSGAKARNECNYQSDNNKWASEELLEFVSHMKNGDTSVLSQFAVQALLLEYIKRNKLRDPHRKSQIRCDARFENLFGKSRVGHFEMLKLLESHFLIKEDSPMDQGSVVDTESDQLEVDRNADTLTKGFKDRKRKMRKKGYNRAPQSNVDEYAAINMHNINLIYLRRKLMEDLLDDVETFHDKVVGMFVRIRISGSFQKQDMYRLVQVVGTSKATEPYKIGKRTSDIMLEILNLNKTEIISIDIVSNQDFTEEECKRLRQSIKCGLISRLTVGDILEKAMDIQAARVNDWLESEILRLGHLCDRASDLGRMKELRECVEKLQLLKTPNERRRRLEEIPEIHADPKMDPSYESDDDGSETDESPRDAYIDSRGSGFSRRERGPISPGSDFSAIDSWSGVGKNSTKTWESSRNLTNAIQIVEKVNEISWNQGTDRDTCVQQSKNLEKQSLTSNSGSTISESVERNVPVSAVSLLTSPAPLSAGVGGTSAAVKINETEKMWLYQDPSAKVQGPFSIVQLRKWSNAGYFPGELRIWRTAEKQEDSILLTDALAGKCQKDLPEVGKKLQSPRSSSDISTKTIETLHQDEDMKRFIAEQKPVQNPNLSTGKSFGNDSSNLSTPTLKQSNGGRTGEGGLLPVETQHHALNAVLTPPTATLPQLRTDSSAASSVLSSSAASSPAPKSEQGGLISGDLCQTPKLTMTSEPHVVHMHGQIPNTQNMTIQPVQSVTSRDHQLEPRGSDGAPSQKVEPNAFIPQSGKHLAHGWGGIMSTVQNPAGNSSNSSTTVMPQTDFWRPPISGIQSNMQPPGMANAPWSENPNPGWSTMRGNPNTDWGTQTPGSMNMNWVPVQVQVQVQPTGNATSDRSVPAGSSGATVQGPASGNVHPGWVATPSWGAPNGNTGTAAQLQGMVPGWGPPAGLRAPIQGPPAVMGAPVQAPPPGNGAPVQGQPPLGIGAPLQGPPQGNSNQGWVAPAVAQGTWGGQQNPNGVQFSGGFSGGRPWNGQLSFGRGGPRPFNRRQSVCPYNGKGRCRKGAYCDYLHT